MKKEQPEPRKIVIKKKTREVSTDVHTEESTNISSPIDLSNQNNFNLFIFLRKKRKQLFLVGGILLLIISLSIIVIKTTRNKKLVEVSNDKVENLDSKTEISNKELSLSAFLENNEIASSDQQILVNNATKIGLTDIGIGDKIAVFYKNKTNNLIDHFLIDPKAQKEKTFKINMNNLSVITIKKAVEVKSRYGYIVIDSSLFEAIIGNNLPFSIIAKMEEVLGYSIDFFHLNKGDIFKVIFTEKTANNQSLGVDRIEAIQYIGKHKKVEAFAYLKDDQFVFVDEYGLDLKKSFLLSPLQYGRMTSAFNLNRLHPVTGEMKAHFGTDYAAPEGTPILAVADGEIEKYESKMETNGNYAKIRHDKTYETQYLHMSAFVQGLKVGSKVRQGQVIGFVGQTGLATGPHVCFRFWKNGVQVNHLEENLPSGNKILDSKEKMKFDPIRDSLILQLKEIDGVN